MPISTELGPSSGLSAEVNSANADMVDLTWTPGANADFHRIFAIRVENGDYDYNNIVWMAADASGMATVDMTGMTRGTYWFYVIAGQGSGADATDAQWGDAWTPVAMYTY